MTKEVFNYLLNYSQDSIKIDRLITSAYLRINKLEAKKNRLIKTNTITIKDYDWQHLNEFIILLKATEKAFTFESLIELFEFVVSPADKIINGAIYTPRYIREYIILETLNSIDKPLSAAFFADLACGCGAFLFSLAIEIKRRTACSFQKIFSKIYGLDITTYSVKRSKILLSLLAIADGEDVEDFDFNIYCGNALNFDFKKKSPSVRNNSGFDVIVGNPPYVCSRNMDEVSLQLIKNWSVAKSGHPDLYIPFFQIGYESLTNNGVLGLITVNTFIKSVNGRSLRNFLAENTIDLKIINFGGEQIFKSRNTYTCLCFLHKKAGSVKYLKARSDQLHKVSNSSFHTYSYNELENIDGWNLVNSISNKDFIKRIESVGRPFKEKYITRNGIATLKNHIYKFTPNSETQELFTFTAHNGLIYKIEKAICRDVINANKIKDEKNLQDNREKIIFPYRQSGPEVKIIDETVLRNEYPYAYRYLKDHKKELSTRDKGKREYETWYAYGRRQSLDISAYKLFFPHICEKPSFVISTSKDLLFYNGIAVISNNLEELIILKKILESQVFFKYIKSTTKDYSSGYLSLSKNYIKNFGVIDLTVDDRKRLLATENVNGLILKLYKASSKTKNSKPPKLSLVLNSNECCR